jgi:hypothetical protein
MPGGGKIKHNIHAGQSTPLKMATIEHLVLYLRLLQHSKMALASFLGECKPISKYYLSVKRLGAFNSMSGLNQC